MLKSAYFWSWNIKLFPQLQKSKIWRLKSESHQRLDCRSKSSISLYRRHIAQTRLILRLLTVRLGLKESLACSWKVCNFFIKASIKLKVAKAWTLHKTSPLIHTLKFSPLWLKASVRNVGQIFSRKYWAQSWRILSLSFQVPYWVKGAELTNLRL